MIILNMSHPLTDDQIAALKRELGVGELRVVEVPVQFDNGKPFTDQAHELVESIGFSNGDWHEGVILNPPALNYITALVLVELHGRFGFFPAMMRVARVNGRTPPKFELAEITCLQSVRDDAWQSRQKVEDSTLRAA